MDNPFLKTAVFWLLIPTAIALGGFAVVKMNIILCVLTFWSVIGIIQFIKEHMNLSPSEWMTTKKGRLIWCGAYVTLVVLAWKFGPRVSMLGMHNMTSDYSLIESVPRPISLGIAVTPGLPFFIESMIYFIGNREP